MPMYEYTCPECGAVEEQMRSIKNRDLATTCKECHGFMAKSIGNGGGFRLLGNGWESDNYATHYGDTPAGKAGG